MRFLFVCSESYVFAGTNVAVIPWGTGGLRSLFQMGADHVEGRIGYPFVKESEYQGAPSWHYNLLFRSAGVIEKVFRMRDTMDCHYSKEPRLLVQLEAHERGVTNYLVDNLQFEYQGSGRIDIHSHRHTLKETKDRHDANGERACIRYAGSYDVSPFAGLADDELWCGVPFHDRYRPELVNARFRYTGQQIVAHKEAKFVPVISISISTMRHFPSQGSGGGLDR